MDHFDAFAAEDLVKGGAELAVPVMEQEARPLEDAGEAEVAGLLRNPGAGRVGRAAGDMDATASELDEEEDVVAAQGERLDGEEVARQDACCLLAQELSPAWPAAPRRGRQSRRQQEPPDRARRDAHTQLQQLTRDPRVAPARVLPRQAQDELANATLDRRPTAGPLRLRPPAAYELSVPAQQRLRRHNQPVPTSRLEHPAQRREEGAIGCPKRRPRLLPTKHQQLMAQNEQFDIFGELAAPAAYEQLQQR